MPRETGYLTAVQEALNRLQKIDWLRRCANLGLPAPEAAIIHFRALGMEVALDLNTLYLTRQPTTQPLNVNDQILIYHFLGCEFPLQPTGNFIPFRELPGGKFYENNFRARSLDWLAQTIQNDTSRLERNLLRFGGERIEQGDLGWRFPVIGKLELLLIYHTGDAEFPPAANLLFDQSIHRVFTAEDVAVLAGRVCGVLVQGT
jgi:hypothetical protein